MKEENTAIRLKKLMDTRGLRQVDILNLAIPYCEKYDVKMNKSDISQYCSGKTEPNQNKLFVLGAALNVNEAWLMGYDVPMERRSLNFPTTPDDCPFNSALAKLRNNDYNLTKEERETIKEELPKLMERAANAFDGLHRNVSDLYDNERARQLFKRFRALTSVGQENTGVSKYRRRKHLQRWHYRISASPQQRPVCHSLLPRRCVCRNWNFHIRKRSRR